MNVRRSIKFHGEDGGHSILSYHEVTRDVIGLHNRRTRQYSTSGRTTVEKIIVDHISSTKRLSNIEFTMNRMQTINSGMLFF